TSEDQINNTYVRLMTSHLTTAILDKCGFEVGWTVDQFITAIKKQYEHQIALSEFSMDSVNQSAREVKPRAHVNVLTTGASNQQSPHRQPVNRPPPSRQSSAVNRSPTSVCAICNGPHLTIYCNAFDLNKRREIVDRLKLCIRCLRSDHHNADCRSRYVCRC